MSDFKKYQCLECEHIYDEAKGDPDSGIAAGTRWADIPDSWDCPICGAPKSFFKLSAIAPCIALPPASMQSME